MNRVVLGTVDRQTIRRRSLVVICQYRHARYPTGSHPQATHIFNSCQSRCLRNGQVRYQTAADAYV